MPGITRQIIGSFEDIGRDIARETVNIPKDIVGVVLSSSPSIPSSPEISSIHKPTDKAFARRRLEEYARPHEKKPDQWEQEQLAAKQKKAALDNQSQKAEFEKLPVVRSHRRRGDYYGVTGKSHPEVSKNVRQD